MKKVLSLLLCASMLITLVLGTVGFAAVSEDTKGTITVQGVESDAKVVAYKIMKTDFNNGLFSGYSFVSSVNAWMKANGYAEFADSNNAIDALGKKNAVIQEAFYSDLAAAIRAGKVSIEKVYDAPVANNEDFVFNNVEMGQYLLLTSGGKNVYKPTTANVLPELQNGEYNVVNATVSVKSEKPSIEKKVNNDDETIAGLGDTVTYHVVSSVPKYPANSINKVYEISDKISAGLTYKINDANPLVVEGNDGTKLTAGNEYTLDYTEGSDTFTIVFDYDKIAKYDKISVTYNAVINEKAIVGKGGNNNSATLKYANDPSDKNGYQTETDETLVYTYGLKVLKYDGDDTDVKLAGAIFKLEKLVGNDWVVVDRPQAQLTTDANGEIKVDQLTDGQYRLVEIQAPGGYNLLTSPVEFTITALKDANGKLTGYIEEGENTAYVTADVPNFKTVLPATGGMGTIIFTVIGLVLMIGAVAYLIVKKRFSSVK